mgnify:CR=1 FL=1
MRVGELDDYRGRRLAVVGAGDGQSAPQVRVYSTMLLLQIVRIQMLLSGSPWQHSAARRSIVRMMTGAGGVGSQAAVRLKKVLGFPNVVHVKGGMLAWVAASLPLQRTL